MPIFFEFKEFEKSDKSNSLYEFFIPFVFDDNFFINIKSFEILSLIRHSIDFLASSDL